MAPKDGSRRTYSDAEKAHALELYVAHGPAEASRQTGIPSATIRSWAQRSGATVARTEAAVAAVDACRLSWAQRRGEIVVRAGEAAALFVEDAISATNSRARRDNMASFAVAVDKAQLLDGGATGRIEYTEAERRAKVRQLRDELAERRQAKAGDAGEADEDDQAEAV